MTKKKGLPKFDEGGSVSPDDGSLPDDQALAVPQQSPAQAQLNTLIQQPGPSHVAALGAPPALPQPKWWQRLGAAAMGFGAGYLNTTAGRPGGIAHQIDPTGAEQAMLGIPQYNRQMQSWQNRVKLAEYEDTQEEQRRQHNLQAVEAESRLNMTRSQLDLNTMYKQQMAQASLDRADAAEEGRRNTWRSTHDVYLPEFINANPTVEENSHAAEIPGLPGTPPPMTEAPQIPGMPMQGRSMMPSVAAQVGYNKPQELTQGGLRPVAQAPAWAMKEYGPGAQFAEVSKAESDARASQGKEQPIPDILKSYFADGQQSAPAAMINALYRVAATKSGAGGDILKMYKDPWAASVALNDPSTPPEVKSILQGAVKTNENFRLNSAPTFVLPQMGNVGNNPALAEAAALPPGDARVDAVRKTINDMDVMSHFETLVRGGMPATAYLASRSDPKWHQAMTLAGIADPQYELKNRQYQTMMDDYVPGGKVGKNIVSLNTLSQHMDEFFEAMKALRNGDTRALNWFQNNMGMQFGSAEMSNAQLANTAVNAELATALKGNATDTEIGTWARGISPNMSPAAQDGAKRVLAQIMFKRLDSQLQPYVNTFGQMPVTSPTPATIQFLQSAGLDPSKLGKGVGTGPSLGGPVPEGMVHVKITDPKLRQIIQNSKRPDGTPMNPDDAMVKANQFNQTTMQRIQ